VLSLSLNATAAAGVYGLPKADSYSASVTISLRGTRSWQSPSSKETYSKQNKHASIEKCEKVGNCSSNTHAYHG